MCHDTTEIGQRMTIIIDLSSLMHIYNSVWSPLHIVTNAAVVWTVLDKRIFSSRIVIGWAITGECQFLPWVRFERMRESAIGVFTALFCNTDP